MNRIKRTCALLLAIVLILGVAFQPGIGGVFAENTEQTEQIAELAPQAGEETAAEPATEATTQPAVESAAQTVTESKVETETAGEPGVLSFYEQLMACGSLIDFEALLCAEENTAALDALSQEELEQLLEHVEKISAAIAEPTEEDTLLSEELLKKLNEHIIVICPECGEANGHAETCSQYKAEDGDYVWAALTDTELAEWLMDEANAETVKAILSSEGEEYDALNSRIEAILSGEDEELVQKLQEYLSKLMEMDEAALLAENGTICFDLALGNVTIGPSGYSGYIYVDGVKTEVKGEHADANKYYIYQSTEANKATTGYKKQTDLDIKQNCQIPEYPRVSYDGKSWTKYVENNINVEKVSIDWTEAAKNSNRTDTKNHIIFEQKSNYTADVTIDNIWSTYYEASTSRTTGGIGAHLDDMTNTTISLRLKGDNRVGCVHYSSDQHSGNKLIFSNGDDASNSGSITVADFKENFGANHWNAVIGAADSPAFKSDMSEGIVIDSGVIYAGATWRDNCTAIGGGGNNYGSVTINSGTVTAVTAGTGTAIGGGIGYGNKGGDTDVNINGGIIYAYNLGINPETDKANGGFKKFVPAAAIGGGGSNGEAGNLEANITITGGTIYAQSMGGPGIGGGGSANSYGGPATIDISGGTIIAKSTGGMYGTETILPGVSIGGGTGADGGGAVKLNISGVATKLRTGSIGGGKATKKGAKIGHADVTISGGDITGQIIMAGGANDNCKFKMIDGRIHSTNLIAGNTINEAGITDPRTDIPILYLEKNGGAVWMQDPNGVVNISGGTIENCTAELGGAVYMAGGNFTLSGSGTIQGNVARRGDGETVQGYGGGVYVTGGNANINGGSVNGNKAQIRGGGVYVTGGNVNVNDGSISSNVAGFAPDTTTSLPDDAGMGGGVYLEGTGLFTMKGGTISGNTANYRGGGIFLTQKPVLTKGTSSGNKAGDSGGGLCVNGAGVELEKPEMQILGNSAKNGGGVAVLNGDFILDGGAVGVEPLQGETQKPNTASEKGGGVYVQAENDSSTANATVNSGNVWYNSATEGGGIYLAKGKGDFTLNGETAIISHNTATNGGGIYLYKDPLLNQGSITNNTAEKNGGGMYIGDCLVTLNPEKDVYITENQAVKGAGIYIHRLTGGSGSTESLVSAVDAVAQASPEPEHRVGLHVAEAEGTVHFTKNTATESGGAVCVDMGYFVLESDKIVITENHAVNGGGVAVLDGNFTMTKGAVGKNGGANTATNGGGVYVSTGEVWLKGGSVEGNSATNGGGAYVTGGDFNMLSGSLTNNTAEENGGGAYVAGGFRMLDGTVGGGGGRNQAKNGGGVYVSEGNVYVIYGEITYNHASMDGGGFFISADKKNSDVLMLSGSLSYNTAEKNGGGMAVRSDNTTSSEIAVEIGCLMYHPVENGRPKSFSYEGDSKYGEYASFDNKKYEHESCPVVKHNNAGIKGGGFYLDSDSSTISFYCIEESENTAADINGAGMDVEGGGVIIGDEAYHNHSHDQSSAGQKLDKPRGYIKTGNATMVNGGQVDIYGDMDNPSFIDEVMVDILDSTHDHFRDHRRSEEKEVYKVHYFENFVGGTGLYTATEYSEPNLKFPVEGALYNRPGYEIRGWCTTAVYDKDDPDSKYYSVGEMIDLTDEKLPGMGIYEETSCDICKNHTDATLLKLYAIWKVNGYLVHFDPNVPVGETYSGSMEDQSFNYDQEKNLTENIFKYTGHIFEGWTINADGTGNLYEDKQPVKNLTTVAGETVTLYAKWKVCDHKDSHRWSYDVIDDGKTLRRKCDCGGQTLHATLSAEDTVYDGYTHEATLTLDDKEAWGEDAPTVTYTGKWINEDIHTGVEGDSPLGSESVPRHAGIYTASITKLDTNSGGNTQNPVTASVEYTIAKADQPAPDKPDYTPPDAGDKTVTIKKLAADPTELTDKAGEHQEAKAQYRLNYSGSSDVAWEYIGSEDGLTKTMDTAYTTYFVEARYEELNDYNASEITRANSAYFFAGNVRVEVECDDGIDYKINFAEGTSDTDNGITMELTLKNGYYLINGKYAVTAQRWKIDTGGNKEEGTSESMPVDGSNDKPSIQNIPNDSYLLIHIGEARKNPAVKAAVVPKQVFSSITGAETTISRDSAYTAAFRVDNYVPDFYNIPKLTFDSNIPEETTIILLERQTNGAKNYWYYRAVNETREVPLTAFQKMGENGAAAYAVPPLGIDEEYANLNYQFIVDFSQSADGYSEDELNMTLEAAHSNEAEAVDAPAIESSVKVSMKDKTFGLTPEETNGNGLTNSFTCTFNVDGSAAASKWDDRASALILKPVNNPVLPADARIKAVIGGETTYLYKNKESFIVPLSLLNTEKKVSLTLESALFPKEEAKYEFTAEWLVSPSKAGKAPVKGDMVGGLQQVIFKSAEKQTPSLKSEGAQRVLTTQGTLNLDIKKENLGSYFIEAKLLRKSESTGEYIETGWNTSPVGDKLEVGLAGQTPGSFCLMLYVKENKDSVAVEMRVPYYFVIKQTE